jgi:glycosyltransferase involved in cell wall biosynthesis
MSFGLPVIVSDKVGFGIDLVEHGSNGYIFPVGDTVALAGYLTKLMVASKEQRSEMAKRSRQIVEEWSNLDLAGSLLNHLDSLYAANGNHEG